MGGWGTGHQADAENGNLKDYSFEVVGLSGTS